MSGINNEEHVVSLSISFVQAVESPAKPPNFTESKRNGKLKHIYESLSPHNFFHLEYQLLPARGETEKEGRAGVTKLDVVSFAVVSKIFTDRRIKAVKCWKENGLTYYGWRNIHTFAVNRKFLLRLFEHKLEVKLWNSKDMLSARARFDRPKVFRLPVPTAAPLQGEGTDDELAITSRPQRLPVVDQERKHIKYKKAVPVSKSSACEDPLLMEGSDFISPAIAHGVEETKEGRPIVAQSTAHKSLLCNSLDSPLKGLSGRKVKVELESEQLAKEKMEGLVTLHINFSELFSNKKRASCQLAGPLKDLKAFEVCVTLETPLMSEHQCRALNPLSITIRQVRSLPLLPQGQREICRPVYASYQFLQHSRHCTPGKSHACNIRWDDCQVFLLGKISPEFVAEYLRGPPLVIELHDRDRRMDQQPGQVVFGQDITDALHGTHTFSTGLRRKERHSKARDPYGVARLDLSGLLSGQKMFEVTVPILNGPVECKEEGRLSVGGVFDPASKALPHGDYLTSHTELTIVVEITQPLTLSGMPSLVPADHSTKSLTLKRVDSKCPFGRLVYLFSSEGGHLVEKVLCLVNRHNAEALGLSSLSPSLLSAALSTYKLTKDQMSSSRCEVITGFHLWDREYHVIVLEGLSGGLKNVWESLPRHCTQDEAVLKVFYNSEFLFSERLYGELDVDVVFVPLTQPLSQMLQLCGLYLSNYIPPQCFHAIMCLNYLHMASGFQELTRNNLFPTADELTSLTFHCGVPVGLVDGAEEEGEEEAGEMLEQPKTPSPQRRASMDTHNIPYIELLRGQHYLSKKDFIKHNIKACHSLSQQHTKASIRKRSLSDGAFKLESPVAAYMYSSQALNSTMLAHEELRKRLLCQGSKHFTYAQSYHHMTLSPVNLKVQEKEQRMASRSRWLTSEGFVFPGVPNSMQSNLHPKLPTRNRVEELNQPFIDNVLHWNTLKPSVDRENYKWDRRADDFQTHGSLSDISEGVSSIHLHGERRAAELKEHMEKELEVWRRKLVVEDPHLHVHRLNAQTELTMRGPRASNQLDKLQGLLKDSPKKRQSNCVPPVSCLPVAREGESCVGYQPGPLLDKSLKLKGNMIPIERPRVGWNQDLHKCDFSLHCYIPTPLPGLPPNN